MNIVIAPSGFKESLDAQQVANIIARSVNEMLPHSSATKIPLVDGGEGFAKALVEVTNGTLHAVTVTGPVGQPVASHFGMLGNTARPTAVLEMAAAAGLRLVPHDMRDPSRTTTYGVGELIRAALDAGAERIIIGCGDSGTNDGGAGMAQALGCKLLDERGQSIAYGAVGLADLATIDRSGLDPRIYRTEIDVALNWHNVLCGERGVARVFGPQKGATPAEVEKMAATLDHYAALIEETCGIDVREMPGGGASGGLGAGLAAFLGARLHPRYDIVMQYLQLDHVLADADLVITAEGSLDYQTPYGKVPAEVARRAKAHNVPVIAFAGTLGKGVEDNYAHGIDAFTSILPAPMTLSQAIDGAETYLQEATERMLRTLLLGRSLTQRTTQLRN